MAAMRILSSKCLQRQIYPLWNVPISRYCVGLILTPSDVDVSSQQYDSQSKWVFTQHQFQLKTENVLSFECLSIWQWFEKTQTFENEFQAAKCYCYLLHVNYKMPFQHTFVKRVMSCTCILHVRSIDMCSVSLQSGITNYWPGKHNTLF